MQVNNPDNATTSDHSSADYAQYAPSRRPTKKKGSRKWLAIVAVAVIVLILFIIGASLMAKPKPIAKPHNTVSKKTQVSTVTPTPTTQLPNGLSNYTANGTDLNFSFTYPSAWSAAPASGTDTTDQPITVTSPLVKFIDASGVTVTGKIVVRVRPGNSPITELGSNNPVAAQDSTQIAYIAPTPTQQKYPYITYIHFLTGEKAAGAFEEVMVTGLQSFKKGDSIASVSPDPVITANFYQCTTQACTGSGEKPLSITNSEWQSSSTANQALAIFTSFKFN